MVLYFESDLRCGVREAADISIGRRAILDEVHADGGTVTLIREATEDDMLILIIRYHQRSNSGARVRRARREKNEYPKTCQN